MEQIILIVIIGTMNILCFYFGAKVGQKVVNKEEIKVLPNPVKAYQEHTERKEAETDATQSCFCCWLTCCTGFAD